MDCSPPGSSVHGILQARILEWVAIPFSRGSCQPRDQTQVSHIAGGFLASEPPGKTKNTGVGCHFLLQCMKVKSESEVVQSYPTLSDPMDCMQPTRLLRPWDFPGKSTGVGCHRLLRLYLNALYGSFNWILTRILCNRYYYHHCFQMEKMQGSENM